jgi:hypothetical protein
MRLLPAPAGSGIVFRRTFRQRFVRLLIVTGPLLVVLEVLGSGVLKDKSLRSLKLTRALCIAAIFAA